MNIKATISLGLLMLLAVTAKAQNPPKPQDDDDVIRVKSNLVNIDVIVKDKKGKYISDLKADDFTISENGVAQKIEFFDAPLSNTGTTAGPAEPAAAPRNYVSLVLDSQTTDVTNVKQVREGAIRYVREQITEGDIVGVFSVTNGLQMLQPFTQDKAKLIATLEQLGNNPDSKNFEQKDLSGNIDKLREFLNSAPSNIDVSTPAGGAA